MSGVEANTKPISRAWHERLVGWAAPLAVAAAIGGSIAALVIAHDPGSLLRFEPAMVPVALGGLIALGAIALFFAALGAIRLDWARSRLQTELDLAASAEHKLDEALDELDGLAGKPDSMGTRHR